MLATDVPTTRWVARSLMREPPCVCSQSRIQRRQRFAVAAASNLTEGPRCITSTVRGGVLKLSDDVRESQCGIVPLLDARTTGLPLAASLEFVCPCSSPTHPQQAQHGLKPPLQGARDVVELVYVLSGQGHLVEAHTGVAWPVQPGVSAVTWARSTYLQPAKQHTPSPSSSPTSSSSQQPEAEPLAVLKFFLPFALLTSSEPTADLDASQRQLLVHASTPASPSLTGLPLQQGILDDAHAVKLLKAAHARTWHGHQVFPQPAVLSNLEGPNSSTEHGSSVQHRQSHAGMHGLQHHMSHVLAAGLQSLSHSLSHSTSQASHALYHLLSSYTTRVKQLGGIHNMQLQAAGAQWPWGTSGSPAVRPRNSNLSMGSAVLVARTMEDFKAFQLPKQTNQLAFVFDPLELGLSLSFGVEIFEPGHHTPLHVHQTGHELFFILSGDGDAYCDGHHIPVRAGDCIVFPPGTSHGLDNNTHNKLYAIQLMCPDDEFVGFVQSGKRVKLRAEDLCAMTARSC